MGEILPDGSIGGYEGYCPKCGKIIATNMQGNEIGYHKCEPSSAKWDPIKKRIVEDKEQDVKPFDFNQLDTDIKRMFPIELKAKIKYNIAGMCHNDLAAEKASEKCVEVAMEHLAEKIKNLPQTYGEKGLGKVYDIAINDVLNLLK